MVEDVFGDLSQDVDVFRYLLGVRGVGDSSSNGVFWRKFRSDFNFLPVSFLPVDDRF